ncbi:MAG: Co2+/Mg2+ efflux protein ApaG [Flavobacteriales bacterium]|nr:MAG: Co2+/Mg2+ efflux protein ApaG [Flavobacteriales bacterium]
MAILVTNSIAVSVQAKYDPRHSNPSEGRYFYAYRVTIANQGHRTVRLLRRKWHIVDSMAAPREVKGPGVVGETPVLLPGQEFTYSSFCDLHSTLGRMEGCYTMRDEEDLSEFEVNIPSFDLLYSWLAN